MRTEKNLTPSQLFVMGIYQNQNSESSAIKNLKLTQQEIANKVSEFYASSDLEEPTTTIVLPRVQLTSYITDAELNTLNVSINVKRESDSDGIDIFAEVLEYVQRCHFMTE